MVHHVRDPSAPRIVRVVLGEVIGIALPERQPKLADGSLLQFDHLVIASGDAAEVKRLMTFVIVGGGPSGVELAGSIAELVRHALAEDFRNIDPAAAVVFLLEAGPKILATFPDLLVKYALRKLKTF